MFRLAGLLCLWLLVAVSAVSAEVQDPMRPPRTHTASPTAPASVWELHSTMVSPEQRSAVINGRAVAVGDWIQGAQVVAIEPAWVRLRGDKGSFVVRLKTYRIKKQVVSP